MTGTATSVSVDGTNLSAVNTAVQSLGIASGDKVITYTIGTQVFITRYQH